MKINAKIAGLVGNFIRARHYGNTKDAKQYQTELKKILKKSFNKVLMMHGDPDSPGNFDKVNRAWNNEFDKLARMSEHNIKLSKLKQLIKEEVQNILLEAVSLDTDKELISAIEKTIKKHFPKSFINVRSRYILSARTIYISFALGQPNEWSNKIIQNDIAHQSFMINGYNEDGTMESDKIQLVTSHAGSFVVKPEPGSYLAFDSVKVRVRKTTGKPDKVLKVIDDFFGRLKTSLKDNKNNFADEHAYAKKYV